VPGDFSTRIPPHDRRPPRSDSLRSHPTRSYARIRGVCSAVSSRFDRPREHAYHDRQGMNRKQRENTSKLLYDIVKFALVGIIFVNFVPGKEINWVAMLTGMIIASWLIPWHTSWTQRRTEMDGLTFAFLLIGAVLLLGWGVLYLQEHRSRKR
jgi:hypothetical protein